MFEKYDIQEIRFLPMGPKEFKTEELAREFLSVGLPKTQNGEYWYQVKGIDSENEILVLFQYQGLIIGVGIFKERIKFSKVRVEDGKEYHGINYFYPETSFNIESISIDEYSIIDSEFIKFSQSIRKTNIKYLPKVLALVEEKWKAYI